MNAWFQGTGVLVPSSKCHTTHTSSGTSNSEKNTHTQGYVSVSCRVVSRRHCIVGGAGGGGGGGATLRRVATSVRMHPKAERKTRGLKESAGWGTRHAKESRTSAHSWDTSVPHDASRSTYSSKAPAACIALSRGPHLVLLVVYATATNCGYNQYPSGYHNQVGRHATKAAVHVYLAFCILC